MGGAGKIVGEPPEINDKRLESLLRVEFFQKLHRNNIAEARLQPAIGNQRNFQVRRPARKIGFFSENDLFGYAKYTAEVEVVRFFLTVPFIRDNHRFRDDWVQCRRNSAYNNVKILKK